ncbi:MAG: chemotaxis protein CheY [Candidatus Entotheonella gemina]|uniref:Chemotaxis protein CheY n=1 Tax=Candidatus Entotheonella gemina TaxID=1429439 RepID=W4M0P4_9BACT|nr:MAG: chemotaxis protein CheY [Candidatus Entotheonella gemina]
MVGNAASQLPVLLVDDEPPLLRSASVILRSSGIQQVITLDDSRTVLPWLAEHDAGAVVLDLTMPHISGHVLLEHITADYPDVPILLMTATNDLDTAVQCMQQGAIDYLVKPVEKSRFVSAITRALELRALHEEVLSLKTSLLTNQVRHQDAFAALITQSPAMRAIFRYVEAIAVSRQPVLITGETGTGKELLARAVHHVSSGPGELVAINVAGLDDTMFSDTLFGHAKGAFTGAIQAREGLITQAANGTLFLDEIGDLAPASQVKLLRLLQEGTYFPLGMDQPRQSRARIIVATNQDVVERVRTGDFRKDLYYRLRAHHLHIPPLRQRLEDLPLLINHFLEKAADALEKPVPTPPRELYPLLNAYAFPGNVRELEVMIFDAVAQHQGGVLSLSRFKSAIEQGQNAPHPEAIPVNTLEALEQWFPDRLPTLKDMEQALIAEALRRANDNQGIAAGMLGLTRQALNRRLTRRRARQDNGN